jgi:glycosyltransferase involved in cell wall biosynthesis
MIDNHKIAVVIPVYNEDRFVKRVIETIPNYVDHVILVNDASTDNLSSVIKAVKRLNLLVIDHATNQGVGQAIVSGYKEAVLLGSDVVAVMAGDGQMDPDDLINLIAPVIKREADYSKGNRFKQKDWIVKMPKIRVVGNFWFSIISCFASGYYHVFDTQCGFTAISKATLLNLELEHIYPGYGYPTDILARLGMVSARVVDVPVKAIYNTESSGIKPLSYTLTIIKLSIKLFIERQIRRIKRKTVTIQNY